MKTQLTIQIDRDTTQKLLEKHLTDSIFKAPVQVTGMTTYYPPEPAKVGQLSDGLSLTVLVDQ